MEPFQTQESTGFPILLLSNELLLHIVKELNASDLLSISASCKRFLGVCHMISNINFENSHHNGLSLGKLFGDGKFLTGHTNPSVLKSLNLNGIHWIAPGVLEHFLIQCHNLKTLSVADTRLEIDGIVAYILPHCQKITSLSFSMTRNCNLSCEDPQLLQALEKLISVEVIMENGAIFSHLCNFLQKCPNLEDLVVSRAPVLSIGQISNVPYKPTIGPFPKLKSLIFVGFRLVDTDHQTHFNVGPFGQQLTTFWSNLLDVPSTDGQMESINLIGLSWNIPRNQQVPQNIREQVRLPTLRSVWEPSHVFMQSPECCPHLKLVNCVYDGLTFQDFCSGHQMIEVLKLNHKKKQGQTAQDHTDRATALSWNNATWKMLPNLTTVSLAASLIAHPHEEGSKKRIWNERIDENYIPYMVSVALNCPMIQELELIGSTSSLDSIRAKDLFAIAQCLNLKHLTLADIIVCNGQFFDPIFKNCTQLESLRIRNVGPETTCCYSSSLVTSLPSAKNLRTFCIIQNFMKISDMSTLMTSLESCRLLSKVALVCPAMAWNMKTEELSDLFSNFC